MPDQTTSLVDRVIQVAGADRFTVDLLDVVTLSKIAPTDTDEQVAAKLARFAEKYPDATRTPDDWLTGLEQDSRDANARGLGKLGIR